MARRGGGIDPGRDFVMTVVLALESLSKLEVLTSGVARLRVSRLQRYSLVSYNIGTITKRLRFAQTSFLHGALAGQRRVGNMIRKLT